LHREISRQNQLSGLTPNTRVVPEFILRGELLIDARGIPLAMQLGKKLFFFERISTS
jgi:hypothetical protein